MSFVKEMLKREEDCVIDYKGVQKILPQRSPFLFVDRVMKLGNNEIEAEYDIMYGTIWENANPDNPPIMPRGLLLEMGCQVSTILLGKKIERFLLVEEIMPFLEGYTKVTFQDQVKPGIVVTIKSHIESWDDNVYQNVYDGKFSIYTRENRLFFCEAEFKYSLRTKT